MHRIFPNKAGILTGQQFFRPMERNLFVLGLFIPQSGPAGIWGPSCRACGELAVHEINLAGGISGLEVVPHIVDAGGNAHQTARTAKVLADASAIDAIVGMHTSDVREAIARSLNGQIPYIYTPLYEGGVNSKHVCCIGETPQTQLFPAVWWFMKHHKSRRWALIGNDYVWPHRSHELAHRLLSLCGASVVFETYHPFGTGNFDESLQELENHRPDVVLLSLVGDDSVRFNREFSRAGLAKHTIRLSCAIEENMLLGIGDDNTERLFCSSGYFNKISSSANGFFKETYHQHFGESAPTLNALAESVYEGVHFLAKCLQDGSSSASNRQWSVQVSDSNTEISVPGPRQARWQSDVRSVTCPVYLAEAKGYEFTLQGVLNR